MSPGGLEIEGLVVRIPRVGRGVAQLKQQGEWGALPTVGERLGKTPVNAHENVGRTAIIQKSSIRF
jgi:hypothetical protein